VTSAWEISPPTLTRRDLGLPDSAVVFACFNRSDKFSPDAFAIWVEILVAVPGAVLWFMEEVAETQANLRAEAARLGLDPQRLIFTPKLPWADFVGVCSLADLFLDTPRYNAGATALCALRAGLPVLTCPGQSYASRMGASINAAAGLEGLICRDLEEYRDKAIALARNPEGLQAVKQRLGQTTQLPLFQPQPWIQELEMRLLELWRDYPALLV
jgi:predicted O-linked N-acetylglucosamine transferase (SPINDLY family)